MNKLRKFLKKIKPVYIVYKAMRLCYHKVRCIWYQLNRKRLSRLKKKYLNKEKITVLFLAPIPAQFCGDELYHYMERSSIFVPVIGVFPVEHNIVEADPYKRMEEAYFYFKNKGFNVIKIDDRANIDLLLKKMNIDIVLFIVACTIKLMDFLFKRMKHAVRCYVSYGVFVGQHQQAQFNMRYHNQCDYLFWETRISLELSKKYADDRGRQSFFFGFPKFDTVFYNKSKIKDVWKIQSTPKKRIIWAPHHSIQHHDGTPNTHRYGFSCFMELSDFMLEIAARYRDTIQFAFKPHPFLFDHLRMKYWNADQINSYKKRWQELENGQIEEGEYGDLFFGSDAMILDSLSFMCEYTVLNKPALFTIIDERNRTDFNELGLRVFNEVLYSTKSDIKADIIDFIERTVLGGRDPKKPVREEFIEKYLMPPNHQSAQKNIYDFICSEIQK